MTAAVAAIGALVPAGMGVCCAASGERPGRIPVTIATVVMLLAMLDTEIGPGVIAPVLWAALLVLVGLALTLSARATATGSATPPRGTSAAAPVGAHHTAIGLVLTAALVLAMHGGVTSAQPPGTMAMMPGTYSTQRPDTMSMMPGTFSSFVLLGTIAFCLASAVVVVRERSMPRRVESVSMAASIAMMAVPLLF